MRPGPVFVAELRVTARRARFFAARSFAGLVLLVVAWYVFRNATKAYSTEGLTGRQVTRLAGLMSVWIAIAQLSTVALLTPALVAGTLAEQRRRRTLQDLLTSDLTSAEIVLGTLAARLLHVFEYLAVGLPILGLLTLLGGTDPWDVAALFAATAAIVFFLGGLSIFVSAMARGPREAVFVAYGIAAFWMAFPPLVEGPIRQDWPGLHGLIEPAERFLAMTNPLTYGVRSPGHLLRMSALLSVAGAVLSLLAVLTLRPASRFETREGRRRVRRSRPRPRPTMGDDPMLWKERRAARVRGPMGLVLLLVLTALTIETARMGWPAMRETMAFGYGTNTRAFGVVGGDGSASRLQEFVQAAGTGLYVLVMLGVATSAAGAITSEREADTWTALAASPLDGGEILRAKRAGAYRRARPLAMALRAMWLAGLVCGAMHPAGFVASMVGLSVYEAFAAALGTCVSLASRSTARALVVAVGTLIFLNGGYLFCCLPFGPPGAWAGFGCTPFLMYRAQASYADLHDFVRVGSGGSFTSLGGEMAGAGVLSLLIYGFGALALNILAEIAFDDAVDRPSRPGRGSSRRAARDR